MAGDDSRDGFGEGLQRGFALDDVVMFRDMMLDIYGGRCAVTGSARGVQNVDALDVFLLQPLAHGGIMSTANAIVVEPAVASLLDKGLLLIGDDYVVYRPGEAGGTAGVALGRRLTLPDTVSLWPERSMLAYRRSLFRAQ